MCDRMTLQGVACRWRRYGRGLAVLALLALPASAQWQQRSTSASPPPQSRHAMVYDSTRAVTLLVGPPSNPQTWEWDGSDWTQRFPQTSPGLQVDFAMAHDTLRGRIVLFGDGTWEWDGTDWEQPYETIGNTTGGPIGTRSPFGHLGIAARLVRS
ncbi:MAG: hypothetical protein AAF628_19185 [Planctomycetota bacterium]